MLGMFIADLSDADLLVRPAPTANHIAWQLGHVIGSEQYFITKIGAAASLPKLPDGFTDQHGKLTAVKILQRVFPPKPNIWSSSTRRAKQRAHDLGESA